MKRGLKIDIAPHYDSEGAKYESIIEQSNDMSVENIEDLESLHAEGIRHIFSRELSARYGRVMLTEQITAFPAAFSVNQTDDGIIWFETYDKDTCVISQVDLDDIPMGDKLPILKSFLKQLY